MQLPDAEQLLLELADKVRARLRPDTGLVGIHTGGVWIAERLHRQLGLAVPLGTLDISFYRDDFSRIGLHPLVKPSDIPFEVEGRHIILVDDVLHTGRTMRAAMNELFDYGRPAAIELAVLIDRGGRELPISAQAVGARVDLAADQNLQFDTGADGRFCLTLHQRANDLAESPLAD